MTSLQELMQGFKNSFLFKGKTARRIVGKKKNSLMESLAVTDSEKKPDKEGAFFAGSREWSDGKAEWYEVCPPIKHRMMDGSIEEFDHVLIAHADDKTVAFGSCTGGHVYNFSERELYSKDGDVSNEKVLDVLGYSFEGDAETVVNTKESGLKSSEKYERYEDEKYGDEDEDEDDSPEPSETPEADETPEGETGTPEPHETETPEPDEDDDEDDEDED